MTQVVKKRYIYWDLKDDGLGRKARVAGRPLVKLDIYAFFELTSKAYVSEHKRVDIERRHLERVQRNLLRSPTGCVKIDPEMFSLQDVLEKQADSANEFKIIGRLCTEKWEELQEKVQSSRLRTGNRPWDSAKQSLIIELTQAEPDVNSTLARLKLI
jgi:hypothetical protein